MACMSASLSLCLATYIVVKIMKFMALDILPTKAKSLFIPCKHVKFNWASKGSPIEALVRTQNSLVDLMISRSKQGSPCGASFLKY